MIDAFHGVLGRRRRGQRRRVVDLAAAAQAVADHLADRSGQRLGDDLGHRLDAAVAGRRADVAQRAHREADEALRVADELAGGEPQQLRVARHAVGHPARRRRRGRALRGRVEDGREHEGARGAVDGGVVDLGQLGDLRAAVDPLDHVQLPEGLGAVHRPGVDAADGVGQQLGRARRGDGVGPDVEVDVELRVLDPVREVEPERDFDEAAAERRQLLDALEDHPLRRVDPGPTRWRVLDVEDGHRRHVAEAGRRLHVEEPDVDPRELLHEGMVGPPLIRARPEVC